jgi:PucR family transcriptional regulator, purine catabolism regulatory protein
VDTGTAREYGVITVRDILSFALPAGTTVAAGHNGLGREVTWATRLRAAPPAFGHISGGEIVILAADILEMIDENLTLAGAIRQLAGFGVSVIATTEPADAPALSAADASSLPLLVLPPGTDLGLLERTAARTIAERRREIQQHGQEEGRKFMELAIGGESLDVLADEVSQSSGRAVSIEGHDGRPLVFQPDPEDRLDERGAQAILQASEESVQGWLRTVGSSSSAEPPVHGWTDAGGWTRLVAPVTGRNGLLGSVSLMIPPEAEGPEDTILTSRAAAAAAVTLAQEQATAHVRREVELNVLDEMLDGALRSEVALVQQAQRLGYDLDQSFCAIIARLEPAQGGPARSREGRWTALEAGVRQFAKDVDQPSMLWRVRNASAEIVWPAADSDSAEVIAKKLRDTLDAGLRNGQVSDVVSIGIGRPDRGIHGIRHSHQEARQALTLGRRLHGSGHVTDYDDLGIYRLILAAEGLAELRTFQDESLTELMEYDRIHNSNLIETLEAFFAANCSPKEAASILSVHRNTVLYRLDRIGSITGQDLDDPEVRLRLHLALHVRVALGA